MPYIKLVLISILLHGTVLGQIKTESAYDFLTEDPAFDSQFMQQKRVKSIATTPAEKRTLQEMIPLEKTLHYFFDKRGRTTKKEIIYTDPVELRDPKNTTYSYTDMGQIQSVQSKEYNSFFTDYFEYDYKGRVKVKSTYRETGSMSPSGKMIIENRELINKQNYSYQPVTNGIKKHYHNNYGRIYKYDLTTFDDLGNVISEQTKFIAAKNYAFKNFYYNENNQVSRIEKNDNGVESELKLYYDKQKRIQKQDVYYAGELKFTTDYIYNERGLLSAQIRMDHASDYMLIYRYEYVFY